jgi:hypothetical protein
VFAKTREQKTFGFRVRLVCKCCKIKKKVRTAASWSNLPNSSLSSRTNSCAEHCEASTVKPTMSANRMLKQCKHKPNQPTRFGERRAREQAHLLEEKLFRSTCHLKNLTQQSERASVMEAAREKNGKWSHAESLRPALSADPKSAQKHVVKPAVYL